MLAPLVRAEMCKMLCSLWCSTAWVPGSWIGCRCMLLTGFQGLRVIGDNLHPTCDHLHPQRVVIVPRPRDHRDAFRGSRTCALLSARCQPLTIAARTSCCRPHTGIMWWLHTSNNPQALHQVPAYASTTVATAHPVSATQHMAAPVPDSGGHHMLRANMLTQNWMCLNAMGPI